MDDQQNDRASGESIVYSADVAEQNIPPNDYDESDESTTSSIADVPPLLNNNNSVGTNTGTGNVVAANEINDDIGVQHEVKQQQGQTEYTKPELFSDVVERNALQHSLPSFKDQHQSVVLISRSVLLLANTGPCHCGSSNDVILPSHFSSVSMSMYDQNHPNYGDDEVNNNCDVTISSTCQDERSVNDYDTADIPIVEAQLCTSVVDSETPSLVHASVFEPRNNRITALLCAVVVILALVIVGISIRKVDGNNSMQTPPSSFAPSFFMPPTIVTAEPSYYMEETEFMDWLPVGGIVEEILVNQSRNHEGISVAISKDGTVLVVGSDSSRSGASTSTSSHAGMEVAPVCVYKYVKRGWVKVTEIYDTFPFDSTGRSVSVDETGSIFAVGSPSLGNVDNESMLGATGIVRIYRINTMSDDSYSYYFEDTKIDTSRVVHGQIGNDIKGLENGDEFGYFVHLCDNGQIVAIASRRGCYIQVFQYLERSDVWVQLGQTINCSENPSDVSILIDTSSITVRLSGDGSSIVVTGPFGTDTDSKNTTGRLHVYRFNDSSWIRDGGENDPEYPLGIVGLQVAISTDGAVLVSCGISNNSLLAINSIVTDPVSSSNSFGECHVSQYNHEMNMWQQIGDKIVDKGDKIYVSSFITSVSIDSTGNVIAIGSFVTDTDGFTQLHAKVMGFNKTQGNWQQIGSIIDFYSAGSPSAISVCLSEYGNILAVGIFDLLWRQAHVFETGFQFSGGDVELIVGVETGDYIGEIDWSVDRLDVECQETVLMSPYVLTSSLGFETGTNVSYRDSSGYVKLESEGVYRFTINTMYRAFADLRINERPIAIVGLENTTDSDQFTFVVKAPYANEQQLKTTRFVTLVIDFDERPYDIHWVLFAKEPHGSDSPLELVDDNQTIIAYGPERVYGSDLALEQLIELIDVSVTPKTFLTFILTDDGRDGLCCKHGSGMVSMYEGSGIYGKPLFTNSTENMKRFAHSFYLS